jgi:hypothetical protein
MLLIGDNDPGDSYGATNGLICLNNVVPGTYTVSESVPPTGYKADPGSPKSATSSSQSCAGRQTANPDDQTADVTFVNIPLSKITLTFESQEPA